MNLSLDSKIVIYTRDYLIIDINPKGLKSIILDINKGVFKVIKLRVFVTDSLGITSYTNASKIKKNIQLSINEDNQVRLQTIKEQRFKVKQEIKQSKKVISNEKKQKRYEKSKGFTLRIKSIFKRKAKTK